MMTWSNILKACHESALQIVSTNMLYYAATLSLPQRRLIVYLRLPKLAGPRKKRIAHCANWYSTPE
ncbi:MAG: hypothetical protein R3C05_14095 [Pirellulaceae bacterium]